MPKSKRTSLARARGDMNQGSCIAPVTQAGPACINLGCCRDGDGKLAGLVTAR